MEGKGKLVGNATVEHVAKSSSDELLRKFAESEDEYRSVIAKRRKKIIEWKNADSSTSALCERKFLLTSAGAGSHRLIGRKAKHRASDLKNRSFFATFEKTWRRTVQGASKVFIEKHYNRHKRLISDASYS